MSSKRMKRSTMANRRRRRSRDGVTVVEFAIIANVLFLCIFTCIEFARVNMVRNMAQDAAYYAARAAMVPGASRQEAIDEVDRLLGSLISGGYTVNVANLDSDAENVRVDIDIDLNAVALLTPIFFKDKTISTTAIMRTERYAGFFQQE